MNWLKKGSQPGPILGAVKLLTKCLILLLTWLAAESNNPLAQLYGVGSDDVWFNMYALIITGSILNKLAALSLNHWCLQIEISSTTKE